MSITPDAQARLTRFYDGRLLPDELMDVMTTDQRWFPHRPLRRGGPVRLFPDRPGGLPPLRIDDRGRTFDLYDFVATNNVVGLIVLKDGRTALEMYQRGLRPDTLWQSCSLAKSVTSILLGIALHQGAIASLDDPVTTYAALGASYERVTVRNLIQMTSGVDWSETYGDAASHRRRLLDAQGRWHQGGIVQFMRSLPATSPPGHRWTYNTGDACLAGAVIEGATGTNLADYASDHLWSRIGMAHDARWWTEHPDNGMTVAGSGINAALGDYARLGQFMLDDGRTGTARLLPDGWRDASATPCRTGDGPVPYGYMWWLPERPDPILAGSFQAEGIYGQYIHVNPAHRLVVAMACARGKPSFRNRLEINDDAFFAAVARALADT